MAPEYVIGFQRRKLRIMLAVLIGHWTIGVHARRFDCSIITSAGMNWRRKQNLRVDFQGSRSLHALPYLSNTLMDFVSLTLEYQPSSVCLCFRSVKFRILFRKTSRIRADSEAILI